MASTKHPCRHRRRSRRRNSRCSPISGGGEADASDKSDEQGRFRIVVPLLESKEPRHLWLVFNKDGYAGFDSHRLPLPNEPAPAIDAGKFTLRPGHDLPIRVVDAQKHLLAGAVVEPGADYALRKSELRTAADGRGMLKDLPAGVVRLQISHGDRHAQAHVVVSETDAENTETELRLGAADAAVGAERKPNEPIAVGRAAPELTVDKWTDGEHHTLADYKGRVVVLDFWGIWCGPCVRSIPVMRDLAEKYDPRDVAFLTIHTAGGDSQQIERLKRLHGWQAPCAIDRGTSESDSATAALYGVRGFPTVIVIDRDGQVVFNSSVRPEDAGAFMRDLRELAISLEIPWPIPEADEDQAILYMSRIQAALFGREIDKALAGGGIR